MKKINREEFLKIYNASYEDWKVQISDWCSRDIALYGESQVDDSAIEQMFETADKKQTEVLNKIFGPRQPKYTVGDWITLISGNTFYDGTKTKQVIGVRPNGWLEFGVFTYAGGGYNGYNPRPSFLRRATLEEITRVKNNSWKKGEPYLTLRCGGGWMLSYATDNYGEFYQDSNKSGRTIFCSKFQKLHTNDTLPYTHE